MLRAWLEQHVLPDFFEFSGRTLPVDTAVAQRRARCMCPISAMSAMRSSRQRRLCMA